MREKGFPQAHSKISQKEKLKINVWGGISCCGVTEFVGFEMNMNRSIYCDILLKFLAPFVFADENDGNMIIHQDNASTHTGEPAKPFLPDLFG